MLNVEENISVFLLQINIGWYIIIGFLNPQISKLLLVFKISMALIVTSLIVLLSADV